MHVMSRTAGVLLLLVTMGLASEIASMAQTPGANGHCVSVWGASAYAPIHFPGMPPAPAISDKTIRMIVRPAAGGQRLRVRFSNDFGVTPLVIGAASVAVEEDGSRIKTGTGRALTFGGRPSVSIPPGAPVVRDPIDLEIVPLTSLAVSIYLPLSTPVSTWHELAKHKSYLAGPGDQTMKTQLVDAEKGRA